MEEEIMEEKSKIQASLQTKKNINVDEGEERKKEFFKTCIFKEISGDMMVEMHYVVHFNV